MSNWKQTFWAVWVANLVTAIGMMSFLPFFPQHLRDLGMTDPDSIARWSAAIFGAAPLTAGLMMPIWGALGDRIGRKAMVLRAMLAICVFVGMMGHVETPLALFFLRIGQGVFTGFVAPSVTLVSVAAPPDKQGRISGSLQTALAAGSVIGPILGGLLSVSIGVRGVFTFVAIAAFVSALCVFFFAHEDPAQRRAKDEGERGLRGLLRASFGDMRAVWANRTLRVTIIAVFIMQFGLGATNPLTELYVEQLFALGGDEWVKPILTSIFHLEHEADMRTLATSVMFGGMALVLLVAMPVWGARGDRVGHARTLLWSSALVALAMLFNALAPSIVLLFAARMFLGGAMAGGAPSAFGIAASEASVETRGGTIAAVVSARTFAVSTGSIIGGQLVPLIGIRGLYFGGSALVALSAAGLWWRAQRR